MVVSTHMLFDWIAGQSGLTGGVIVGAGLVTGLQGFRLFRFLVIMGCGLTGYLGGAALAAVAELPAPALGVIFALAGALLGIFRPRLAAVIAHGALWGVLTGYAAGQIGLHGPLQTIAIGLGVAAGVVLTVVSRQMMVALSTSLSGASLIVLGLMVLASDTLPVVGTTFRTWALDDSPMVGLLVAMLTATVYSYQASARKGDFRVTQAAST